MNLNVLMRLSFIVDLFCVFFRDGHFNVQYFFAISDVIVLEYMFPFRQQKISEFGGIARFFHRFEAYV